MRFNGDVTRIARKGALLAVFVAVGLVAAACGRSGFQYIENDDGTVFAKIPEHWELLSEGLVNFTLTGEDGQLSVLPGDDTLPWQTLFDADPDPDGLGFDRVLGAVEVQPVDRRLRSDISLLTVLGFDPNEPSEGIDVLSQNAVRRGDLNGVRVLYQTDIQGLQATVDRLVLTDDRFAAFYEIRMFCDEACYGENAQVIDEIMNTFTVEP